MKRQVETLPQSNSSPAWSLVLGCLEEFPTPAPFSFVPQLPNKTANLGRLQRMGFRSAKLGSSVQSSLQSRWKNPRSLILVNSLVVVFKSSCPDFQNLAWLRNQLSKLLSPAVEQCCCSSSSAAAAWSDARVAVTQAFAQKNTAAATRLSH